MEFITKEKSDVYQIPKLFHVKSYLIKSQVYCNFIHAQNLDTHSYNTASRFSRFSTTH